MHRMRTAILFTMVTLPSRCLAPPQVAPACPLGAVAAGALPNSTDVTFSAYLVSSDTFTFYTWIHVSTAAVGFGIGGADAQAYATWGTGSNSYSWWMAYS